MLRLGAFRFPTLTLVRSVQSRTLSLTAPLQSRETGSATGFETGEWNDPSSYHGYVRDKDGALQTRLKDPTRFQHVSEREERSVFPPETWRAILSGKYFNIYRGLDIMKGPVDMTVYSQLFWHVRPRTVIELGAFTGASAIWMADVLKHSEIECNIFSVDIDLSLLQPLAKKLQPPNVTFLEGDCMEIEKVFPSDFLSTQPRPMIVIDDAHQNFDVVMAHFHRHIVPGDYLVCEDTTPYVPMSPFSNGAGGVYEGYEDWGPEKLHDWKGFLATHNDKYAIDAFFTDFYGYNSTSNWDGFARRMK